MFFKHNTGNIYLLAQSSETQEHLFITNIRPDEKFSG